MIIFHSTACSSLVLHFTVKFWFYILHFIEKSFYSEILLHLLCARAQKFWHFCNQIWHFTACMGYFPLYSSLNFPVLQSLFGLVSILHFDGILFYILQVHLFSNYTARTLVIFHSTFSKKASLRLYILHINPPLSIVQKKPHTLWKHLTLYSYQAIRSQLNIPMTIFWPHYLDLWPMTLTYECDLDILPLDLLIHPYVDPFCRCSETDRHTTSKLLYYTVGCDESQGIAYKDFYYISRRC